MSIGLNQDLQAARSVIIFGLSGSTTKNGEGDKMRFEATTTEKATVLSFNGEGGPESTSLRHADVKNLTVPEALVLLSEKIGKLIGVEYQPAVQYIELCGDEDDEDLSLFEEVIDVKGL